MLVNLTYVHVRAVLHTCIDDVKLAPKHDMPGFLMS
jgi:hypothetical protein